MLSLSALRQVFNCLTVRGCQTAWIFKFVRLMAKPVTLFAFYCLIRQDFDRHNGHFQSHTAVSSVLSLHKNIAWHLIKVACDPTWLSVRSIFSRRVSLHWPIPIYSVYSPVCGSDGVTYSNSCVAECSKTVATCSGSCPCTIQFSKIFDL